MKPVLHNPSMRHGYHGGSIPPMQLWDPSPVARWAKPQRSSIISSFQDQLFAAESPHMKSVRPPHEVVKRQYGLGKCLPSAQKDMRGVFGT